MPENQIQHSNKSPLIINPQTAVSLGIMAVAAVGVFGAYKVMQKIVGEPGRFGQGGASYENEKDLKKEIDNLRVEIKKEEIPLNPIAYKTIADAIYSACVDAAAPISFTFRSTTFAKIVEQLKGLKTEELKQVVVEFGTRPNILVFGIEYGGGGSIFDWFVKLFNSDQLNALQIIFASTKLWKMPQFPVLSLFGAKQNKENAKRWQPWLNASGKANGQSFSSYAYPIAGNTMDMFLYDYNTKRRVDAFRPSSYTESFSITLTSNPALTFGAQFILTKFNKNIIGINSKQNLNGKSFWLDTRYFNQYAPSQSFLDTYKLK